MLVLSIQLCLLGILIVSVDARATALPATFQGEVDSDGPLVIDPHSTDDPQTRTRSPGLAYWIQRMPQTKAVNGVTLGDFGQGSCPGSPTAYVRIEEVTDGDPNAGGPLIAQSEDAPLPATPGRIHWDINYTPSTGWNSGGGKAVLLQQGRTYVFMVNSNCSTIKQTTWGAVDPKIETPEKTCIGMLPTEGLAWTDRQWHDALVSPPTPCSDSLNEIWPYEPDGWLVSVHPGSAHHIDMWRHTGDTSGLSSTPDSPPCGDPVYATVGIVATRVYPSTSEGDEVDDICSYTQFHPPGYQSRYGWSTAVPLVAAYGGGPRLSYLRLDTVNWDDTLLQEYAPALKFDSSESYLPESVDGLTSIRQTTPDCSGDATKLAHPYDEPYLDTTYAIAKDAGCGGDDRLDLNNLGPVGTEYPYRDTTLTGDPFAVVSEDDILNLRGSDSTTYQADSAAIYAQPGWARHAYGHVRMAANGELWLQYWFWFYYNDGGAPGADDHEGDWEGIQLHFSNPLAANPIPDHATYNQHDFHSICDYAYVETAADHPVVYVSRGRHASYFDWEHMPSGVDPIYPDETDARWYTPSYQVTVEPITSYTPAWMRWPGRWGSSTGDLIGSGKSPDGPAWKGSFMDPASADASARTDNCHDLPPVDSRSGARSGEAAADHSADGDGPAPLVAVTKIGRRVVLVRWSIPESTGGRVPEHLLLATHATDVLAPAVSTTIDTGSKRNGVARLALPKAGGSYELVGRIQWDDLTTSAEALQAIAGTPGRR